MEKIKGTMYWIHNHYEIYEDEVEIVIWKNVHNQYSSTIDTHFVMRYIIEELLVLDEEEVFQLMTIDEPFSLAIEILMQMGRTPWKW